MTSRLSRAFATAQRLYRLGRLDEAEAIYRAILKQAHDPHALNDLSVVMHRQGRKADALGYLRFAQHVGDLYPYLSATLLDFLEDPDLAPEAAPATAGLPVKLRAFTLFRQGAKYDAVKTLQGALAERPSTDLLRTLLSFLADPECAAQVGDPLGGPLNAQAMRRRIVTDIIAATGPAQIFETGSFLGVTTAFLAGLGIGHVFSCEIHAYNQRYAARRLAAVPNATVVNLESREFLRRYLPCYSRGDAVALFYLDAHWEEDLPLLDEIALILEHVRRPVMLVDDFEVPDDPGYGFDDYGPDRRLTLDHLAPVLPRLPHRYFPGPSADETGNRRGCIVLTPDAELGERLARVPDLRPVRDAVARRAG
jgi:tetratricopeptide (TPR) repeat protein